MPVFSAITLVDCFDTWDYFASKLKKAMTIHTCVKSPNEIGYLDVLLCVTMYMEDCLSDAHAHAKTKNEQVNQR